MQFEGLKTGYWNMYSLQESVLNVWYIIYLGCFGVDAVLRRWGEHSRDGYCSQDNAKAGDDFSEWIQLRI